MILVCWFTLVYAVGENLPTDGGSGDGGGLLDMDNKLCDADEMHRSSEVIETTIISSYPEELKKAYFFAHGLDVTTKPTIDEADLGGKLIRAHLAKMIVNYATKVLDMVPDTSKVCEFTDIANQPDEFQWYIKAACQLGLMHGDGNDKFLPAGYVTRGDFATVLSRALFGEQFSHGGPDYYSDHIKTLKDLQIFKDTNPKIKELRWNAMLMLMRAQK